MARKRIPDFYHRPCDRRERIPTIASCYYYIARSKSDRVERDATNLACAMQNSRESRSASSLKIDEFTIARTFDALFRFICSDMRETSTELNEIAPTVCRESGERDA